MTDTLTQISSQVKHQFPAFYREQGPQFVAFLEAYYEWMEQQGNIIDQSRRLFDTTDIDRTADQYLEHFKAKFMAELPVELIGNQRLFQKHILELYRSKGSVAGLKLLFRLMYNEDVDVYIPSYDIFKASDNVWKQPHYLEVTLVDSLWSFQGKSIRGASSGARAIVENVEQKSVDGKVINLINISNLFGEFAAGESVIYDGLGIADAPVILGSPVAVVVQVSSPGFTMGDLLIDADSTRAKKLTAVVSNTYFSIGTIDFRLEDGGTYYSMDAEISITAGSNTSGAGAQFVIGGLSNTSVWTYTTDKLADYIGVDLNATAYGFPANPTANSATVIAECLEFATTNVGTISSIIVIDPGSAYDGDVSVSIVDPYTSSSGLPNGRGGFAGLDAVVTGESMSGSGLIRSATVYDAGHGYSNGQYVAMQSVADSNKVANVWVITGGTGVAEGYFDDTSSFASSDKYIFDGHYYQDFSYAIKSGRLLKNYIDVLKKTVHVAGNAVYGLPEFTTHGDIGTALVNTSITQSAYAG